MGPHTYDGEVGQQADAGHDEDPGELPLHADLTDTWQAGVSHATPCSQRRQLGQHGGEVGSLGELVYGSE